MSKVKINNVMNNIIKETIYGASKSEYNVEKTNEGWVVMFDGGVYEDINSDYGERLGLLLNNASLSWEMNDSSSFTVYKH